VPTIAAISLFYMVNHWISWSNALLYIQTAGPIPLQMVLRQILIQNRPTARRSPDRLLRFGRDFAARKLSNIARKPSSSAIVPIICVYRSFRSISRRAL
jgi:ABC-type glycerol-3-phosphate transport system permease component